eukprot:TRINITY_DN727_c2_g1_i1.p1 TRINITY_DN727_c2_g1~~TRINITY_DN727_c2_g1_i1.p1  ORF type:complete len:200 (+),score=5.80 TRINITY_DN727_c2_g1_i1:642-1241(+)
MQAKKSIQCGIINRKTSPKPLDNGLTHHWDGTRQTCHHCGTPKRHLTPRKHVTQKCSHNHEEDEDDAYAPHSTPWMTIAAVVKPPKHVDVNHQKEHTCTVGVKSAQKPSTFHIHHHKGDGKKSVIHMIIVMHCQQDSSQNLHNETKKRKTTKSPKGIQIAWAWINCEMVVKTTGYQLFVWIVVIAFEMYAVRRCFKHLE